MLIEILRKIITVVGGDVWLYKIFRFKFVRRKFNVWKVAVDLFGVLVLLKLLM